MSRESTVERVEDVGLYRYFEYGPVEVIAALNNFGSWELYLSRRYEKFDWPEIDLAWRAADQALSGRKESRGFIKYDERKVHLCHNDAAAHVEHHGEHVGGESGWDGTAGFEEGPQEISDRAARAAGMARATDYGRGVAWALANLPAAKRILQKAGERPTVEEAEELFEEEIELSFGKPTNGARATFDEQWQEMGALRILLQALFTCAKGDATFIRDEDDTPSRRRYGYFVEVIGSATLKLVGTEVKDFGDEDDDESKFDHMSRWERAVTFVAENPATEVAQRTSFGQEDWGILVAAVHERFISGADDE